MPESNAVSSPLILKIFAVLIFVTVAGFLIYKETINHQTQGENDKVYFESSKSMDPESAEGINEAISDMPLVNESDEPKKKKPYFLSSKKAKTKPIKEPKKTKSKYFGSTKMAPADVIKKVNEPSEPTKDHK